ncbi:MAG: 5-formyltetrahydrofolate cyclo-ligase [Crenarchaeota archaeon]|nr:5-formyltetrahydrofolate cyclo-ligase [Thermoproteota archaeon]MDA1124700.1 5-formyltetrahydrofolate cyclo-ligase [Thermoproteota archaeon]
MTLNPEKDALRKHLLEKRDSTSFELMVIHSEKIISKLMKTKVISEAKSIGCYYSIGSEVKTVELITQLLNGKKSVSLPRISNGTMTFRIIDDLTKLEKGEFDIPAPKDNAPVQKKHDVILVPCVGLDNGGNRVGYGQGFYDKYLEGDNAIKIALSYSKQIVKSIPVSAEDIKMDWIITERDVIKTS